MFRLIKRSLIPVIVMASSFICVAQKSFMDISLLGGYSLVPEFKSQRFAGIVKSGSVNFHITENISIGPFFSSGQNMEYLYDEPIGGFEITHWETTADQSLLGLNVRLSTNRNKILRPYLNISISQLKMEVHDIPYAFDKKATKLGIGLGLMIKATRNLYSHYNDNFRD